MITPLEIKIEIDEGADFDLMIDVTDMFGDTDLTGYEFLGELRQSTDPTASVIAEFSFEIQDQYLQKGQVLMSLSEEVISDIITSTAYPLVNNRLATPFMFDVKMKDTSGKRSRILQGIALVVPQATQEEFT